MVDLAAHQRGNVLVWGPMGQWVLSFHAAPTTGSLATGTWQAFF